MWLPSDLDTAPNNAAAPSCADANGVLCGSRSPRRLIDPTSCAALAVVLILLAAGCSSSNYLQARRAPRNPLNGQLQLLSRKGPKSTVRTQRLLRRYALNEEQDSTFDTLERLSRELQQEPRSEKAYAYAELSYIRAKDAESGGDESLALKFYGGSVMHSFMYLFDPRFDTERNPYDPQYRGACDLYNGALESALRITRKQGKLVPGVVQQIDVGDRKVAINISLRGPWHADEFERFEFVSDFELKGLANRHHQYGLGVPMIAVRRKHANEAAFEEHYPSGLSFPVTAFLRLEPGETGKHYVCNIELHDALATRVARVGAVPVPLETDLSTALAYSLDRPEFRNAQQLATTGFLNPNKGRKAQGIYMLEPYDPSKIPVMMVHGLWSDPLTWMEMFNDLRSFPELRSRYQFWFYLYPTGQPFWISAAQMRTDLAELHEKLDPQQRNALLNQTVLVGHSMGGLVSRLQVIDSGDAVWNLVSDKPFHDVKLNEQERRHVAKTVFFRANPGIKRVVSIGTPYRGSNFANDYTRWLSRKFINVPKRLLVAQQKLMRLNEVQNSPLLGITTSIDSLAPESPMFAVLDATDTAPWVQVHNIVGIVPDDGILGKLAGQSDGVVELASAQLPTAKSELVVQSDHTRIHQNPRAILEVRRILLQHLTELDGRLQRVPPVGLAPLITAPNQSQHPHPLVVPDADIRPLPLP